MISLNIVANRYWNNTYTDLQYKHLQQHFTCYYGLDFFWENNFECDVYLFHWPEYIGIDYNQTIKRLYELKQKGKLLIGIYHNKYPHFNPSEENLKLYKDFYLLMDGIIHLGEYSVSYFKELYPKATAKHIIISHPIYEDVPNTISKEEARKKLGIKQNDFTALCFGNLRNKSEVKLLYKIFNKIKLPNKKLLIAGGKIDHYQSRIENLYNKLYKYRFCRNSVIHINKKINDKELQNYFNASDLLIIPRTDTMNSGVIYMGYFFKKAMLVPNVGNIPYTISKENNYIFDINKIEEISTIKFTDLQEKGKNNYNFAIENFSQEIVAKKISSFINELAK